MAQGPPSLTENQAEDSTFSSAIKYSHEEMAPSGLWEAGKAFANR